MQLRIQSIKTTYGNCTKSFKQLLQRGVLWGFQTDGSMYLTTYLPLYLGKLPVKNIAEGQGWFSEK